VDRLAKAAAVEDGPVVYDKIPREVVITRGKENGLQIWQQQWTNAGKGAMTKAFFSRQWGLDYDRQFLYSQNLQQRSQDMGN
jgi:hypothetical protein